MKNTLNNPMAVQTKNGVRLLKQIGLSFLLSLACISLQAGGEEKIASSVSVNQFVPTGGLSYWLDVSNRDELNLSNNYLSTAEKDQLKVKLYFDRDYESDPDLYLAGTSFEVEVKYSLEYIQLIGPVGAKTRDTVTLNNQALKVRYDVTEGGEIIDYVERNYSYYDAGGGLIGIHDVIKAKITGTSITVKKFDGTTYNANVAPKNTFIEIEIASKRYVDVSSSNPSGAVLTSDVTNRYFNLEYPFSPGADYYEIEWLFISDGIKNGDHKNLSIPVNFKDANRIRIRENYYALPMEFSRGSLIHRYRLVSQDASGEYQYSAWSYTPSTSTISAIQTEQSNTVGNFFYHYIDGTEILNENLNWEYTSVFAENGLRKDQLQFFDGLGRNKQSVSLLSSDGNAVVSESEYDYAGRPSIQLMPAPVTSQGLQYYAANPNFTPANYFSDTRLDQVTSGTGETPAELDAAALATQYYSPSNSIQSDFRDFIPDAKGYPYSQMLYDNNGTGRVIQQSAPGDTYAMKEGKNKTFIYGRPKQEELDRLFGNEAGLSINYSKDYQIDENSQISITYKDGSNRVVATCLSGNTPSGMDALPRNPEEIVSNLFKTKTETSQAVFEDFTIVTAPVVGNYTFTYSLGEVPFNPVCTTALGDLIGMGFPENSGLFEIEIKLINIRTGDLMLERIGSYTSSNEPLSGSKEVTLLPGQYMLKRTIKPNFTALETAIDGLRFGYSFSSVYLDNELAPCANYQVLPSDVDCSTPNCSISCLQAYVMVVNGVSQYLDASGNTYTSYDPNDPNDPVTMAITNCQNLCEEADEKITDIDFCGIKYKQIINSLSPGGQYFDNIAPRLQYDTDTKAILLNPDGSRDYDPNQNWFDWLASHFATPGALATAVNSSISFTSWQEARDNWDESMSAAIMHLHPEYCTYELYCECLSTNDLNWGYINLMNRGNTMEYATTHPNHNFFNPLAMGINLNTYGQDMDNSGYINYDVLGSDELIVDGSDAFDLTVASCELLSNESHQPHGADLMRGDIMNRLMNFITFTPTNSSDPVSHSIWYVLNDPDDIAQGNTANLPADIINFYNQLHGGGGVENPMFDSMNKYEFFRSIYLFYREMAIYNMVKYSELCVPNPQDDDRDDYDGLTSALNGWQLVFPPNMLFDNIGEFGDLAALTEFFNENLQDVPDDQELRDCLCNNLDNLYNDFGPNWSDVENEITAQVGSSPTVAQLQTIYTDCQSQEYTSLKFIFANPYFNSCVYGNDFDGPASMAPDYDPLADCLAAAQHEAEQSALAQYLLEVEDLLDQIRAAYLESCRQQVLTTENFTLGYEIDEYQFTLYYYDQSGNLIKTVPPEGVKIIPAEAAIQGGVKLSDVEDHRKDSQRPFIRPEHDFQTHYRYNTLNQIIQQFTPDGGESKFWYDRLGRIVLSQNAKQASVSTYSYSLYDELGRVVEAGECSLSTPPPFGQLVEEDFMLTNLHSRTEVTHTLYDQAYTAISVNMDQEYLQNRVSATFYYPSLSNAILDIHNPAADALGDFSYALPDHAYLYDYDVLGNVKTLYSYSEDLSAAGHNFITIAYDYDLLNGNVKKVSYEPGKTNAFYHRYTYDADNRIQYVETSLNDEIWDREAAYYYYPHGPLARIELGEHLIQGQDFAYTLQGWLKTVNSSTLGTNNPNQSFDLGQDGKSIGGTNPYVGRDAFAYSLSYYSGDYSAIGTLSNQPIVRNIPAAITANDLYNGNISAMSNQMRDNTQQAIEANLNSYRYDQLNRITSFNTYADADLSSSNDALTANTTDGGYGATYAYDKNGNLTHLTRKRETGTQIDNFTYSYFDPSVDYKRNRLVHLGEAELNTTGNDITTGGNYTYDAIGNLTSDDGQDIDNIDWTVSGKVKSVQKTGGDQIDFKYDALGNRIEKEVPGSGGAKKTFYVRDASGNAMATYTQEAGQSSASLAELNVFGSDRLGVLNPYTSAVTVDGVATDYTRKLSHKSYELKNHLGNVLATVSDAPLFESDGGFTVNHDFDDGTLMGWYPHGANNTGGNPPTILTNIGQKMLVETSTSYGAPILKIDLEAGQTYTFRVDLGTYTGLGAYPYPPSVRLLVQDRTVGSTNIGSNYTGGQGTKGVSFTVPGVSGTRNIWLYVLVTSTNRTQPWHFTVDNAEITTQSPGILREADVVAYQDYYPFGMQMPGRFASGEDYRYGFNGMEKDDEVKGAGNSLDFGARIYDSRIGRWMSLDPLMSKYPHLSPYNFAANSPITFLDPDGRKVIPAGKEEVKHLNAFVGSVFGKKSGFKVTKKGIKVNRRKLKKAMETFSNDQKDLANRLNEVASNDSYTILFKLGTVGSVKNQVGSTIEVVDNYVDKINPKDGTVTRKIDPLNPKVKTEVPIIKEFEGTIAGGGGTFAFQSLSTGKNLENGLVLVDPSTQGNKTNEDNNGNPLATEINATTAHELLGHVFDIFTNSNKDTSVQTENKVRKILGLTERSGKRHGHAKKKVIKTP